MNKSLQRWLLLLLLLVPCAGINLSAQEEKVDWTEVHVVANQVSLDQIPENVVNLKLIGSMAKFDFELISRKIQSSLLRIDLSGLTEIDGATEGVDFPAKGLRDLPHLKEVTFPRCVSTIWGSPLKGSEAVEKIILKNPNMQECSTDGYCNLWGFRTKGEPECKKITLVVPKGSKGHFSELEPWKLFNIVEDASGDSSAETVVKMNLSVFGASSISVKDKTAGTVLLDEVKSLNSLNLEKGHVIEIDAEGRAGKVLYQSYIEENGKEKVDIEKLPFEFTVGDVDIESKIQFARVLTYGVRGGKGSLKAEVVEDDGYMQYDIASGRSFEEPEQIVFTATPAEGYKVKAWYKDGVLQESASNVFKVGYPTKSFNVEVEFASAEEAKAVTLSLKLRNVKSCTLKDKASGKVLTPKAGKTDVYDVVQGQVLIVDAEGKTGYDFQNAHYQYKYLADLHKIESMPAEIPVTDRDLDIVINYNAKVTYAVKNNEGGQIKAYTLEDDDWGDTDEIATVSGAFFSEESDFVFRAKPDEGYFVKAWYKNGQLQEGKTQNEFYVNAAVYSLNVEVEFAREAKSYSVSLKADPSSAVEKDGLKISVSKDKSSYKDAEALSAPVEGGDAVRFFAKPKPGYEFAGFFIGEEKQVSEGNADDGYTFTVESLDKSIDVVAGFLPVLSFKVLNGNGVVIAQAGDESLTSGTGVKVGTTVSLKAIPRDGYQVKRWSVNGKDRKVEGTEDLYVDRIFNIEMTQDPLDIFVEYEKKPVKQYEVYASVNNQELGTITMINKSVNPPVEVKNGEKIDENTGIEFKVILNENVKLEYWMINGEKNEDVEDDLIRIKLDETSCKDGKLQVVAYLKSYVSADQIIRPNTVGVLGSAIVIVGQSGEHYSVFALNGMKLAAGICQDSEVMIDVASGAYIVAVGHQVFRVIVK